MISATPETGYKPENIAKASIKGLELSSGITFNRTQIKASYSLLNPENLSPEHKGKILNARAKQLFTVNIDHTFKHFSAGASVTGQGPSFL